MDRTQDILKPLADELAVRESLIFTTANPASMA
jgi:hypothetical protein